MHALNGFERAYFSGQRFTERLELLAKRHRHGILQLGAAHLQNAVEFLPLGPERRDQLVDAFEHAHVAERHADMQRGRIGVVRGLRRVHVVVRIAVLVFALLMSHQLEGPVGDDFVGVHVGRGAGAPLEHVELKLVVELAVDQFVAGGLDSLENLGAELAALLVRTRRGHLHHGQGFDEIGIQPELHSRNVKIIKAARRLHSIVGVGRHRLVAKKIALVSGRTVRHGSLHSCAALGPVVCRCLIHERTCNPLALIKRGQGPIVV